MVALSPITKTQALKKIEELGFPNPSPKFLGWYFAEDGDTFIPIVDFNTLAIAVKKEGLVAKMADVVGLPYTNRKKDAVLVDIHKVIKEHRFVQEVV